MPTTIEGSRSHAATGAAVALALAGWVAVLAGAALATGSGTVVALGGPSDMAARMQAGVDLVSSGRGYLAVRPNGSRGVASLYAAGAWIVLPAPGAGCLGRR